MTFLAPSAVRFARSEDFLTRSEDFLALSEDFLTQSKANGTWSEEYDVADKKIRVNS
jgi:hypothetical protein